MAEIKAGAPQMLDHLDDASRAHFTRASWNISKNWASCSKSIRISSGASTITPIPSRVVCRYGRPGFGPSRLSVAAAVTMASPKPWEGVRPCGRVRHGLDRIFHLVKEKQEKCAGSGTSVVDIFLWRNWAIRAAKSAGDVRGATVLASV